MRKKLIVLGIILASISAPIQDSTATHAQQEVPTYAKWGRLAMEETQSKYPSANIVDYLYEGSEVKGNSTIQKFKLWLKDGDKEFGVFIRIEYTTESEKVVNIEFEETTR